MTYRKKLIEVTLPLLIMPTLTKEHGLSFDNEQSRLKSLSNGERQDNCHDVLFLGDAHG